MEFLNILAQVDGQELVGRIGDGSLIRGLFSHAAVGSVCLLLGWLGFRRPAFLEGKGNPN